MSYITCSLGFRVLIFLGTSESVRETVLSTTEPCRALGREHCFGGGEASLSSSVSGLLSLPKTAAWLLVTRTDGKLTLRMLSAELGRSIDLFTLDDVAVDAEEVMTDMSGPNLAQLKCSNEAILSNLPSGTVFLSDVIDGRMLRCYIILFLFPIYLHWNLLPVASCCCLDYTQTCHSGPGPVGCSSCQDSPTPRTRPLDSLLFALV